MTTMTSRAPKTLGSISDYQSGNFHNKQFIFVLNHINEAPSYTSGRGVGIHYPPSYCLDLVDEIYDPGMKKQRMIRYIPGELSIYKDEQSDDEKNPKKVFSLEFVNGEKYVDGKDVQLLSFLMLTNKNGSNPNRDKTERATFLTVDPGQGLQEVIAQDEKMSKAQHFCYNGDWDEVAAYAMVLGVPMDRDTREIRYALRQKASADVDKFMKGLESPNMKRKYFVMEALKSGIIKVNKSLNAVLWADDGAISQAPLGKDPIDDFVELTFSPQGERTYATIMGILRPESAAPQKLNTELKSDLSENKKKELIDSKTPLKPELVHFEVDDLKLLEMVETAIKNGVIEKNIMWHKYRGSSYNSVDKFINALKTTPAMWEVFKSDLGK